MHACALLIMLHNNKFHKEHEEGEVLVIMTIFAFMQVLRVLGP